MDYTYALSFTCPARGRYLSERHGPTASARGFRGRRRTTGCNFGVGNLVTLTALYLERRDRANGRSIAEILLSSDAAETITSVGISRCHRMLRRHTPAQREPHPDWQMPDSETGGRVSPQRLATRGLVKFLYRLVEPCPPPKQLWRRLFSVKPRRRPQSQLSMTSSGCPAVPTAQSHW